MTSEGKIHKVYIIGGPNGAGKTTFARGLLKKHLIPFVNADDIAKELNHSNTNGADIKAGRLTISRIDETCEKMIPFAVETTLSGKMWERIIKKLVEKGYSSTIYFLFLRSTKEAIERIERRYLNGGHYIPAPVVVRRYYRSCNNFWEKYRFLVDRWIIIDNSGTTPIEIVHGIKDNLTIINESIFERFLKVVKGEKDEGDRDN